MDLIFKQLLKYIECPESCMKNLILEPFAANQEKNI